MASKKSSDRAQHSHDNQQFWQQLEQEFAFDNVDEEQLRQQTEQWLTCTNEILGQPPARAKKKTKR